VIAQVGWRTQLLLQLASSPWPPPRRCGPTCWARPSTSV